MVEEKFSQNEKIIFEARKHWLKLVVEIVGLVIACIVPFFLLFLAYSVIDIQLFAILLVLFMFWYSVWLLVIWFLIYMVWLDFYLDVWIVTNFKLIEVEQKGFFHREISTLQLDKVQDVTVTVNGFLATWLDFGHIEVQTAGSDIVFEVRNISRPYKLREAILQAGGEYIGGVL